MASGTQVLPGIVHSAALGAILSEYLAKCATQPAGLGSGGVVSVGGSLAGVPVAADGRRAGHAAEAHETADDMALVSRRGQITGKMLRDNFHLPLHTVAKKFGMCTTAFKKLCRRFEIPKWPHRQVECPFPTPRPARRERVLRGLPHADACSGRAAAGDR